MKNNRVPNDYTINGLERNDFNPSNDLYGSFCSVQVRLQSDDMDIQNAMKGADWATTYFAVGDTFTCGSWIPSDELEELANAAVADQTAAQKEKNERVEFWTTLLGTVGGTIGGAYLGGAIQQGTAFGNLTGLAKQDTDNNNAVKFIDAIQESINRNTTQNVSTYLSRMESEAKSLNVATGVINAAKTSVNNWLSAQTAIDAGKSVNATQAQKDAATTANSQIASLKTQATTDLDLLRSDCENADGTTKSKDGKNLQWLGPTIGAVVTGAAGGFLVNKATRDIQQSNLSAAEKAAYEEWMENVGRHIKCYIGADEAGDYGDILSVSMD